MKKFLLCALGWLSASFFFQECQADIVMIGGQMSTMTSSDAPQYPFGASFSIGQELVSPLPFPSSVEGSISSVAIDPLRGTTLFAGSLKQADTAAVFRGAIGSSSLQEIVLSTDLAEAIFVQGVFDLQGNAFLGGALGNEGPPILSRLALGKNQMTSIELPGHSGQGMIAALGVLPNSAILAVGMDFQTYEPLVYLIPPGENTATLLQLPDPSITGSLQALAIDSKGTAVVGGVDLTNNHPLIYRLVQGSSSLEQISVPLASDGVTIAAIAMTSNGTAVLVGNSDYFPAIYTLSSKSSSAEAVAPPNANEGFLYNVVIDSKDVAYMGGGDFTDEVAMIFQLQPNSLQASSVPIPSQPQGFFFDAAIGVQDVAVFVGSTYEDNALIYTLSTKNLQMAPIGYSLPFPESSFTAVAVYSSYGLYDKRRIDSYYNLQVESTKNKLRKAGL